MSSQAVVSTPLNILCLDGGGVRGLSALIVLRRIIDALQVKLDLPEPPRPWEVFDLICGTSTGGLIALMLGRLRMTVEEAIACYCQFAKDVFGSKVVLSYLKRLKGEAMYDASDLERSIKQICFEHGGSEDAPLRDPRDGQNGICRVFVVAVTQVNAGASPKLFRSYRTKTTMADKCAIWEAARATTAATTFFDPMKVGDPSIMYLDGGLSGANNPSKLALQEIRNLFPRRPIGCFLSLGTGVGEVVSVSRSYKGIAEACVKLITDCQITDNDVAIEFQNERREDGRGNPYFRFSAEKGVGTIKLDESDEVDNVIGVTSSYLDSHTQSAKIDRCSDCLLDTIKKRE